MNTQPDIIDDDTEIAECHGCGRVFPASEAEVVTTFRGSHYEPPEYADLCPTCADRVNGYEEEADYYYDDCD